MAGGFLSGLLRLGKNKEAKDAAVESGDVAAGPVDGAATVADSVPESTEPLAVRVESVGACRRTVSVRVSSSKFLEDYDQVVKLYANNVSVPGFRKGKAPPEMVERRYGKEMLDEARERMLPRYYGESMRKAGLTAVGVVDLSDVAVSKDTGFSFCVTVDVAPEFKVPGYTQIPLQREKTEVTVAQADGAIQELRMREATYRDISERPARVGDVVQADYSGEMDGRMLSEANLNCDGLASGKDMWIRLAEPDFIPGFTKGLDGAESGKEYCIESEFPADYHVEAVKGRKVSYKVQVKVVREPVPAALDQIMSRFGVDSEEALRAKVMEHMTVQANAVRKESEKQQILTYLVDKTSMSLPESVVGQAVSSAARRIVGRMMMEGARKEDVDQNRESILKAASATATRNVKAAYILAKIAEAEKIEVTQGELDAGIEAVARRRGIPTEQFRSELEDGDEMEGFAENVLSDKTLEYLWSRATGEEQEKQA